MVFDVLTIFPDILSSYFGGSILKRALKDKKAKVNFHDLRDWTSDKHRTVDDTPYGGGAGMVMKVEPVFKAVEDLKNKSKKTRTILLSARGKLFDQRKAKSYLEYDQLILVCGRYEGVDQRVADKVCDEEISIGEYVLTGGELPAAVVIDSVTRLIPGVLGNEASLSCESHLTKGEVEYPQYTRPESFRDWKVPKILLSGDHGKIEEWRKKHKARKE